MIAAIVFLVALAVIVGAMAGGGGKASGPVFSVAVLSLLASGVDMAVSRL